MAYALSEKQISLKNLCLYAMDMYLKAQAVRQILF
jgi:hypothetical protein